MRNRQAAHFADISEIAPPVRFGIDFMFGFLSEPNGEFLFFQPAAAVMRPFFSSASRICSAGAFPHGSEMKTSNSPC